MSVPEQHPVPADPSAAQLPRGVAGAFVLLLCAVVPFIMFAVSYEVVMRFFFGRVTLWLNDVTGYLMLALTFLGGAYVMARDGHVQVDIVVEHTSAAVKRRLKIVNAVLVLLVALVLAAASGFTVVDSYQRNLAMVGIIDVPRWLVLTPIFVGSVLLVVERILYLRRTWRLPAATQD